jgi:hypothetical protein
MKKIFWSSSGCDRSCLFRLGDYRNNGNNLGKLSWVRVPVKIVSVVRKLSTIEERRKEHNCFGEEITGAEVTNPKTVLGSSGFRNGDNLSVILNDTYRMIRRMVSFRAIRTVKKCKHLSNFPAVTLRALF